MAHVRDNILTLADATRNPICASAARLDLYSTASQRDFTVTKKGPPGPVRNEPRGEGGARQNGAPFRLVISDGPSHGYYGGFRAGKKWGGPNPPAASAAFAFPPRRHDGSPPPLDGAI
jgi:hypothetical protein